MWTSLFFDPASLTRIDDDLLTSDDVDALRELIYWGKEADTV